MDFVELEEKMIDLVDEAREAGIGWDEIVGATEAAKYYIEECHEEEC